jgi:hypothetical protein
MSSELPETLDIFSTSPTRVGDSDSLAGHNAVDADGRWIVQLSIHDNAGGRLVNLFEGDTFEFGGARWQVSKIYEPRPEGRSVATLTRV